jgi:lipopolysaccharide/colanic/teichoic acid biosynthesis glycosyltransferase
MLKTKLQVRRQSVLLGAPVQLVAAVTICVALPFMLQTWSLPLGWHEPEAQLTAMASLIGLLLGYLLHSSVSGLPGTRESSGILPSYLISFGLVLTIILMARIDYSRSLLILGFVLTIFWFYLVYLVTQRQTTLVLGVVEGGRVELLRNLHGVVALRLELDDEPVGLDAVCADFRFPHSDAWEARLADYVLRGISVYHAKDLYESLTGRTDLEHLSENTFGALAPLTPFQNAKRVIDFLTALPVAVILSPLLLIVAVAIRVDSSGPALFRQERIGFRGQPFTVYKFRTMRIDEELEVGHERERFMTRASDRRITRLGRFLRTSRIDELPQIFNILRGEMSWIGPRPEASPLSEWYKAEIPFYRYRHVVVPGITGWAQVSQGHVAELHDVKTKLQYDFFYIRNFSVWLDLLIITKTIKIMMTGYGSK